MENCLRKFKIFKNGFTLAEVLITLVIIGVVAALTISAVINTYIESSTVAKVKKGLSILGQAKKLAETQNGSIDGWDFGEGDSALAASQFWNYLKPHLSLVKECIGTTDCYQNTLYWLRGDVLANSYNTGAHYIKFILADGSVMWFRTGAAGGAGKCSVGEGNVDNVCAIFWYDINGIKKPNTLGKDIFLYMMSIDGVYPDSRACNKSGDGWGCSGYIIKHNNMNYLH